MPATAVTLAATLFIISANAQILILCCSARCCLGSYEDVLVAASYGGAVGAGVGYCVLVAVFVAGAVVGRCVKKPP